MVQLFYYENLGKNYRKLMHYEGKPFHVNLYPNEDVGSALSSYWIVKIPWWSKTTAKVLEVKGCHHRYASAKVEDLGNGNIIIKGRFLQNKDKEVNKLLQYAVCPSKEKQLLTKSTTIKPKTLVDINGDDFILNLTTNVSNEDFQNGYSMTGSLERGHKKVGSMSVTHFAVVKRKGY